MKALSAAAILARMPSSPKKLFLVDAMAHVYRAFFAPMPQRLTGPGGVPTNVPFLFGNILRRLIKDYQPEYIGIVFDPPGATFRDKLFEKYKAQRQPMPDEMRVQLPFVRRLCEAMRLPVLEVKGYEADDVIGTMAVKAANKNLEVLIVSNDKDMMQLVGKTVRTLRTGSGGAKADIIVDEKRVEELLGVPPEQVVDYMALLGDTIDNIPGAKGIGEKGAAELIRKYGNVESALDHADEVSNKRYREALQRQREQVLMSKQLAKIATDAPIDVKLQELELRPPDNALLTELYRELGFSSLLKELGAQAMAVPAPMNSESAAKTDYAQLGTAAEFREYLAKLPAKQPLSIWLNLEVGERESEGFGTRIASIEVSPKAGEGRSVWFDEKGEALRALVPLLADSKRAKIVHDPKLFQLLTGRTANIAHATQLYSYLVRPTTANHNFTDVVMRQFNVMLGGGPGERADYLQRLAPALRAEVEEQQLADVYEKIDLPLAPVLADIERVGIRVDRKELDKMSLSMEKEVRRLEKEIWELAGSEFNVNSPTQLAEILFDKLNLQPNARRGKAKARSIRSRRKSSNTAKSPNSNPLMWTRCPSSSIRKPAACTPVFRRPAQPPAGSAPATQIYRTFPFAANWAAKFAPPLSPKKEKFSSPPTTRRSSCASWPIFRKIRCWSKPSAMAKTFTRAPPRKCSGSGRLRKPPNTAAPPKPSISESSTASRLSASRSNLASTKKKPRNSSTPTSLATAA
jgi:DNA polymerase-1